MMLGQESRALILLPAPSARTPQARHKEQSSWKDVPSTDSPRDHTVLATHSFKP